MTERVSMGPDLTGQWRTSVDALNGLIGDVVQPTTEVARVISAVANGDPLQETPSGGAVKVHVSSARRLTIEPALTDA